jgi:hypothetical protein
MYWEREQEINLLHIVLEAHAPVEDDRAVDQIVGGLIEMDLVDMDRAPIAQQKWHEEWEGYDVPYTTVVQWYRTDDEIEDGH